MGRLMKTSRQPATKKRPDIPSSLITSEDGKTVTWDRVWYPGLTRRVTRITWKNPRHVPTCGDLVTAMWTRGNYYRITPPVLVEDYVYRTIFGHNIITGKVRDLYDRGKSLTIFGRSLIPRGKDTERILEIGSRTRFIIDYDKGTEHIGED